MAKRTDWTDRSRTTQPRAGEWLKNSRDLIGLFLLAAGVVGVPVCLSAAAKGQTGWAIGIAIAAGLALSGGAGWLLVEGRRIRQFDLDFDSDRREQRSLAASANALADGKKPLPV